MFSDEVRPSSEIDSYCTKCRMVTNHRVVAMQDGVVKRVVCLTCDGQHNFRPPPGQKKTKTTRAKRVKKEERRLPESQTLQHWQELKEALDPETEPVPYNQSDIYESGQALQHPHFGLGFVNQILGPKKMTVLFEKEIKTLVMNYS